MREYERVERRRFDQEIRPLGQPAVLRGLGADWPAVRAARHSAEAAADYLRRFSHAEPVPAIVGPPEIEGRFFYTDDLQALNFTRGQTPLGPFLDRLLRDRAAPKPYAMAIQSTPADDLLPGFAAENRTDLVDAEVVPRLWLGNAIRVATHFDLSENIGVVLAGRRRFTVFPPDQIGNLYMGPMEFTPAGTPISLVHPDAPDLDRFPRFAAAWETAQTATLEPGDAIYLPYHWWHAVESLEPFNLFMNYWWNGASAESGSPYDAVLFALYALRPLPPEQRQVWRAMFDHLVFQMDGDPAAHLPPEVRGMLGPPDAANLQRMREALLQALRPSA